MRNLNVKNAVKMFGAVGVLASLLAFGVSNTLNAKVTNADKEQVKKMALEECKQGFEDYEYKPQNIKPDSIKFKVDIVDLLDKEKSLYCIRKIL